MSQLTVIPDQQIQPTTATILQAAIQGGVTSENVGVVERLVALQEREMANRAAQDFAMAFTRLQGEMPKIVACKPVPGRNPSEIRYKYAPYEEIMGKARGPLQQHGFAITFDTAIEDKRVVVTCTLLHEGGHSRSNKFACRIGSGPPGSSEAQGDGAAVTYAKRFALCAALNIIIEQDTDARNEGDGSTITQQQADELREMCDAVGPGERKEFLRFAQAADFEDILSIRYRDVKAALAQRMPK